MSHGPFVGIDISKQELVVALGPNAEDPLERFSYTEEATQQLVGRLQQLQPTLIVLEATGGLERPLLEALQQAGLPAFLVQPRRVRAFAYADGRLAKTDLLDARLLAAFAARMAIQPTPQPDETRQTIRDLLNRRKQLLKMRTAEHNRLATAPKATRSSIQQHLEWLNQEIQRLEEEIQSHIDHSAELSEQLQLLTTIPGIGKITAYRFLTLSFQSKPQNAKQLASFIGVAPHPQQSGPRAKKRHIFGGCQDMRNDLYMATLAAIRINPALRPFFLRLRRAGKPFKVALVAAMRKLLTIIYAILKSRRPWDPALHTSA